MSASATQTSRRDERSAEAVVGDLLEDATDAAEGIRGYDQSQVDELVRAVGRAVHRDEHATEICETTVEETGLGNVDDKLTKLRRGSEVVAEDLLGEQSVGVVEPDLDGVVEIAKPVGVVGALVPSTNPGPTIANLAMLAVKGRNAVVFSVSPHCLRSAGLTVDYVREELARAGAPRDLVQLVPGPANKERAHELMERADVVQVTGSSNNVEAGQTSGTPNYCVGEGNVVAIVDETADVERAAASIAAGTAFDYGTPCVSENSIVVHERVRSELLEALASEGGYVCTTAESARVERALFPDGDLDRSLVGRPPSEIAAAADLAIPDGTAFLVAEGTGVGPEYPLSGEKLAAVVTTYSATDFEAAIDTTREILRYEGTGHSCVLHTTERERAETVGRRVDVCRVGVNQSGFELGIGYENGLTPSLSMGAGPWGGNQLDENLSYEHFVTTTRVAMPVSRAEPDPEELFGRGRAPDEDSTSDGGTLVGRLIERIRSVTGSGADGPG